jgi:hypothetical protein
VADVDGDFASRKSARLYSDSARAKWLGERIRTSNPSVSAVAWRVGGRASRHCLSADHFVASRLANGSWQSSLRWTGSMSSAGRESPEVDPLPVRQFEWAARTRRRNRAATTRRSGLPLGNLPRRARPASPAVALRCGPVISSYAEMRTTWPVGLPPVDVPGITDQFDT